MDFIGFSFLQVFLEKFCVSLKKLFVGDVLLITPRSPIILPLLFPAFQLWCLLFQLFPFDSFLLVGIEKTVLLSLSVMVIEFSRLVVRSKIVLHLLLLNFKIIILWSMKIILKIRFEHFDVSWMLTLWTLVLKSPIRSIFRSKESLVLNK